MPRVSKEGSVDVVAYIQVKPDWGYRFSDEDESAVNGARAVALTQTRPRKPVPDTVMVKVTLRIPRAAFYPLVPEAVVVVPERLTEATPVTVEASDPSLPEV